MGLINKRIFVEKREGFQIEKSDLLKDLNENLKLGIKDLRVLLVYDVFNIDDKNINIEYFKYCARVAKKCGVFDTFGVDDKGFLKINLRGRKCSMVRYYFKTIFKSLNKLDGIKRLVDIILT